MSIPEAYRSRVTALWSHVKIQKSSTLKRLEIFDGLVMNKCVIAALCSFVFFVTACSKQETVPPIKIAINPWPGYEFLYLAKVKGFYEDLGVDVRILQLGSLSDAQRAYVNGHADGLASTLIEVVQAEPLGGLPLKVVLVPDYSNGGDVIVARSEIDNVKALKGKKVGCEIASLGLFVLQRGLSKHGLSLDDIEVVNVEQGDGQEALNNGSVDAFVTYPPVSISILKQSEYKTIFSSAEIPFEIVDTLALSTHVLEKNPDLVPKLHKAWKMALDYTEKHPDEAYKLMAERENISVDDFKAALADLAIISPADQKKLFKDARKLQKNIENVCDALVHAGSIKISCQDLPNLMYSGEI